MSKVSISIISIMMFVMIAVSVSGFYVADSGWIIHPDSPNKPTINSSDWSAPYYVSISNVSGYGPMVWGELGFAACSINQLYVNGNCPAQNIPWTIYPKFCLEANASNCDAAEKGDRRRAIEGNIPVRMKFDGGASDDMVLQYSLLLPYDTSVDVDVSGEFVTGGLIHFDVDFRRNAPLDISEPYPGFRNAQLRSNSYYCRLRIFGSEPLSIVSNGSYTHNISKRINQAGTYPYSIRCTPPTSGYTNYNRNYGRYYDSPKNYAGNITITSSGAKADAYLDVGHDRFKMTNEQVIFSAVMYDTAEKHILRDADCNITIDDNPGVWYTMQKEPYSRYGKGDGSRHTFVKSAGFDAVGEYNYQVNCSHPDYHTVNNFSQIEIFESWEPGETSAGSMKWIAELTGFGEFSSIAKQDNYIYAVDKENSVIVVLDVINPLNIDVVWGYYNSSLSQRLVYVKDNYLSTIYYDRYSNPSMMAKVYDLSNPEIPEYVNDVNTTLSFESYIDRFVSDGDYGYLIPQNRNDIMVFNYSDPSTPTEHGLLPRPWVVNDGIMDVKVVDDILYSVNYDGDYDGFYIVDISNKNSPQLLGNYSRARFDEDNTLWMVQRLYVEGDFAYTISSYFFCVFNISNPASISKTGCVQWMNGDGHPENPVGDVVKYGNKVIFGADGALIEADVSDPYAPYFSAILEIDTLEEVNQAVLDGNRLYLGVRSAEGGGLPPMIPQGFGISEFEPSGQKYSLMIVDISPSFNDPILPSGDSTPEDNPDDPFVPPFPPPSPVPEDCRNTENYTLCSGDACISWADTVYTCNQDFANNVIFGDCFVAVNMAGLHYSLNSTTYLLYNNSDGHCGSNDIFYVPEFIPDADAIRAYNTRCLQCDETATSAGFLNRFSVGHFSSYAIGGNSRLDIYDQYEDSTAPLNGDIVFYANYTNITSGAHVPGATCMISFDSDPTEYAMADSGAQYTYTLIGGFSSVGTHQFHVNCIATNLNEVSTTDDIVVAEVSEGEGEIPEFNLVTVLIGLAIVGVGVMVHRRRQK